MQGKNQRITYVTGQPIVRKTVRPMGTNRVEHIINL